MDGPALILVCLLIGTILARCSGGGDALRAALAGFAVRVSLSALVLLHLHVLPMESGVLLPAAMPPLVFVAVGGAAWGLGRLLRLRRETVGCFALVCGTGNTSIVGVPLTQAYLGAGAIGSALVADQANFLVMVLPGLLVANVCSQDGNFRSIVRRLLTYPPVLALAAALLLRPVAFPDWMSSVLTALGGTLTPLALVSVGLGLRLNHLGGRWRDFLIGAGLKLGWAPAAVFLLYRQLFGGSGLAFDVSVLGGGVRAGRLFG